MSYVPLVQAMKNKTAHTPHHPKKTKRKTITGFLASVKDKMVRAINVKNK